MINFDNMFNMQGMLFLLMIIGAVLTWKRIITADGQKLLAMLSRDGGAQLRQATDAAAKGNTADIVHMIARLMESEEGAKLVRNINDRIK